MIGHFGTDELRHVFLHELAHVKRLDVAVSWLVAFGGIFHWFNPALWFGFRRMAGDREMACDELVLAQVGRRESARYGEMILKLLEFCSHSPAVPGLVGILENQPQLKQRIAMIASFGQRRHRPQSDPHLRQRQLQIQSHHQCHRAGVRPVRDME